MALITMLCKVVQTLKSVDKTIQMRAYVFVFDHLKKKGIKQYFNVVLFIMQIPYTRKW